MKCKYFYNHLYCWIHQEVIHSLYDKYSERLTKYASLNFLSILNDIFSNTHIFYTI